MTYIASGDDDFFSSDLDDDAMTKVWGCFRKPVLVLHSANDEYVPKSVSKMALVDRWTKFSEHINNMSGLIPGAGHSVQEDEAQKWLAGHVVEFLSNIS